MENIEGSQSHECGARGRSRHQSAQHKQLSRSTPSHGSMPTWLKKGLECPARRGDVLGLWFLSRSSGRLARQAARRTQQVTKPSISNSSRSVCTAGALKRSQKPSSRMSSTSRGSCQGDHSRFCLNKQSYHLCFYQQAHKVDPAEGKCQITCALQLVTANA